MDSSPKMVVLTDKAILNGHYDALQPLQGVSSGSLAADYRSDSRRPQIWHRQDGHGFYRELDVEAGKLSGYSFSTHYAYKSTAVQADSITGDVYALEQISNLASRIICRKATTKTVSVLGITSKALSVIKIEALSAATDLKIDSFRRVLWIADTCGHRVLKIDLSGNVLQVYANHSFVLPCSLAINPNNGDAFVRWYASTGRQEIISRLSADEIQESYYTTGEFYGQLDSQCLPLNSPGSQSMAFDGVRNRLWWVSNDHCKRVGMIDLSVSTGRNLTVYCEESSSSSQSSQSSSSQSSSSLSSSSLSRSSHSSQSSQLAGALILGNHYHSYTHGTYLLRTNGLTRLKLCQTDEDGQSANWGVLAVFTFTPDAGHPMVSQSPLMAAWNDHLTPSTPHINCACGTVFGDATGTWSITISGFGNEVSDSWFVVNDTGSCPSYQP